MTFPYNYTESRRNCYYYQGMQFVFWIFVQESKEEFTIKIGYSNHIQRKRSDYSIFTLTSVLNCSLKDLQANIDRTIQEYQIQTIEKLKEKFDGNPSIIAQIELLINNN